MSYKLTLMGFDNLTSKIVYFDEHNLKCFPILDKFNSIFGKSHEAIVEHSIKKAIDQRVLLDNEGIKVILDWVDEVAFRKDDDRITFLREIIDTINLSIARMSVLFKSNNRLYPDFIRLTNSNRNICITVYINTLTPKKVTA